MSRPLSVLIGILLIEAGCMPPRYVEPGPNEPHAILKVRQVVHQIRGERYASDVMLGKYLIASHGLDANFGEASTFHVRIRPKNSKLSVSGESYHYETRTVTKSRNVQESYSCSQYSCSGYGSSRHCGTTYSTCYRSKTEYYTTTEEVKVVDDSCSGDVSLLPRKDGVYLLQFNYLGENECTLKCFEQTPSPSGENGEFDLAPCPPPEQVDERR